MEVSIVGRIYDKAQKGIKKEFIQEILDYIDSFPEGTKHDTNDLVKMIDDIINRGEEKKKIVYEKRPWDFSKEKASPTFATDNEITLRPFIETDKSFYYSVARQYAVSSLKSMYSDDKDMFWLYTQKEYAFFCVIEIENVPAGYIAIQDTREAMWEFSIELDKAYCNRGYGPRSILLFLHAIEEITLHDLFIARVEIDNLASQACMLKIGAKLIGLADGILKTKLEKETFEKENLESIDSHMIDLAAQLGVEPRKLLSHVLKYEIQL